MSIPPRQRQGIRVATVGLVAAVVTACAGAGSTGAVDPNLPATGSLAALAECAPLADPVALPPVAGLVLPDGAVVTSVTPQPPLVTVTAEVAATPVAIRVALEARTDLSVLRAEDEVFESELLVSDGSHRTAITATAVCRDHSAITAVVAPDPGSDAPAA